MVVLHSKSSKVINIVIYNYIYIYIDHFLLLLECKPTMAEPSHLTIY
jgi:hypothetical protein